MNAAKPGSSGESLPESSETISLKPVVNKSSKVAGFAAWIMLFFLVMIKLCNQQ
jgi:MFS family permease